MSLSSLCQLDKIVPGREHGDHTLIAQLAYDFEDMVCLLQNLFCISSLRHLLRIDAGKHEPLLLPAPRISKTRLIFLRRLAGK